MHQLLGCVSRTRLGTAEMNGALSTCICLLGWHHVFLRLLGSCMPSRHSVLLAAHRLPRRQSSRALAAILVSGPKTEAFKVSLRRNATRPSTRSDPRPGPNGCEGWHLETQLVVARLSRSQKRCLLRKVSRVHVH